MFFKAKYITFSEKSKMCVWFFLLVIAKFMGNLENKSTIFAFLFMYTSIYYTS